MLYVTVSWVRHNLKLYTSEGSERLIERAAKSRAKENPGEVLSLEISGTPWPETGLPISQLSPRSGQQRGKCYQDWEI